MPKKSKWSSFNERRKQIKERTYNMCVDCEHFGNPVKNIRWRGEENCMLHECEIHPGCMNTRFSIGCGDWKRYEMD